LQWGGDRVRILLPAADTLLPKDGNWGIAGKLPQVSPEKLKISCAISNRAHTDEQFSPTSQFQMQRRHPIKSGSSKFAGKLLQLHRLDVDQTGIGRNNICPGQRCSVGKNDISDEVRYA
jgi:hypothetical protein